MAVSRSTYDVIGGGWTCSREALIVEGDRVVYWRRIVIMYRRSGCVGRDTHSTKTNPFCRLSIGCLEGLLKWRMNEWSRLFIQVFIQPAGTLQILSYSLVGWLYTMRCTRWLTAVGYWRRDNLGLVDRQASCVHCGVRGTKQRLRATRRIITCGRHRPRGLYTVGQ